MYYLLFSFLLGVVFSIIIHEDNWLKTVIGGLCVFVFFGSVNFFMMPTMSFWGFSGVWIELLLTSIAGFWVYATEKDYYGDFVPKNDLEVWRAIPAVVVLLVFVCAWFTSSEMIHTKNYNKLLVPEMVEDSVFAKTVHPIPVEKMISVKQQYAEDLASRRIENLPSLGSRCEFGRADMININGSFNVKTAEGDYELLTFDNEKVWVLPLEHRGFWKWMNNEVTDGYCIVSAHDPGRIFFVTELEGKPLALRYLRSGCFSDEIERHVRTNGYEGYGLTEYSMEIDDNGRPYWVITVYEPTIGFSGDEAIGCLVVDMQTGEIVEYGIDDAPEWVDRIQPDDFLLDQINDWGQYQQGWLNSIFAQNGVRKATPGMTLVYSEGRSFWYTGIQSAGADKSSSGFMLIDSRTKQAKLYPVAGINEQAAQDVIEAQSEWVRMSKFEANEPVLYNVHGVPTYYMTLTGDGIKNSGYAFVSLKSELLFSAASTQQKALAQYLKVLQDGGKFGFSDGDAIAEEIQELTVRDIAFENGTYYLLFNEVKGKEFTATSDAFSEIKWVKVGQKVKVSYTDTKANVISLGSFDIINFDI